MNAETNSALEHVRELLPWWVTWAGPVTYLLVVSLASMVASRIVIRVALRGWDESQDMHWTERSRRCHPARIASGLLMLFAPIIAMAFVNLWQSPLDTLSRKGLLIVTAAVATASCIPSHVDMLNRILPRATTTRRWLADMVVIGGLMYPTLPLTLLLLLLVPREFGHAFVWWLGMSLLFLTAYHHSGGMTLLRVFRLAHPAGPRLQGIVSRVSQADHTKPPPSFEITWSMLNALALPSRQQLAFSSAALAHLNDEQLEAIAAHELGHLAEPKHILWLRSLAGLYPVLFATALPAGATFGAYGALPPIGIVLLLGVFLRRLSRRMEHRADDHAHELDNNTYACALETIYRMNGLPATMYARGTHPQLSDRLAALAYAPSYPRPAPPSRWRARASVGLGLLVKLFIVVGATVAQPLLSADDSTTSLHIALATSYGGPAELESLAAQAATRGDLPAASRLYSAALTLRQE